MSYQSVRSKAKKTKKNAIKRLCEAHGVKPSMGDLFLNEIKLMDKVTNTADAKAFYRAKLLGLIPADMQKPVEVDGIDIQKTVEQEELQKFAGLPKKVQFKAVEYYAYMKKLKMGMKLSHEELKHCAQLCETIDRYGITPLSFEADVLE